MKIINKNQIKEREREILKRKIAKSMTLILASLAISLNGCNSKNSTLEASNMKEALSESEELALELRKIYKLQEEKTKHNYSILTSAFIEYEIEDKKVGKVIEFLKEDIENNIYYFQAVTDSKVRGVARKYGNDLSGIILAEKKLDDNQTLFAKRDVNLDFSYIGKICESNQIENLSMDVILKIEDDYAKENNPILVENIATNEWTKSQGLFEVISRTIDDRKVMSIFTLESSDNNEKVYRSVTIPEITMIETKDSNGVSTYKLSRNNLFPEELNEEFTKKNKVFNVKECSNLNKLSYEEAYAIEMEFDEKIIGDLRILEYLQMHKNLLSIKEKLNISDDEDNKYQNIPSIGDPVNLKENSLVYKDIYSLKDHNNGLQSLYGTKEARYIKAIVMEHNGEAIEVDNMEDYELFKNNGFSVIGYNLVNQYSLDSNGNLICEMRTDDDSIELVFKP